MFLRIAPCLVGAGGFKLRGAPWRCPSTREKAQPPRCLQISHFLSSRSVLHVTSILETELVGLRHGRLLGRSWRQTLNDK